MDSTKGFPVNEYGITKPAHSCVKQVAHAFLCIGMQFLKRSCAGGFYNNCLKLLEGFWFTGTFTVQQAVLQQR